MTDLLLGLGPQAPGTVASIAPQFLHKSPVTKGESAERALGYVVSSAKGVDFAEDGVGHAPINMRGDTRTQAFSAGCVPLLRVAPRIGHIPGMADEVKIDVVKLRSLIVANTGEGKKMTRRKLSMLASGGRNPDLVRDLMRANSRRPTLETAAGICSALGVDISTVVRGVQQPTTESDEWLTVSQAVQAGVWREQIDWAPDECFEVRVGPPVVEGSRYGVIVEGRSMDRKLPPGTILQCVRLIGSGLIPEDGDYVIVERKQGALRELTVKRLSVLPSGDYQLVAESTLPEFRDPITIGKPDFNAPEDGQEITVVAIAVRAHLDLFDLQKRRLAA